MLCWPPGYRMHGVAMFDTVLENFRGNKVIFIGERYTGMTGSDRFHELLNTFWTIEKIINIPNWPLINDQLFLYTRKNMDEEKILKRLNKSELVENVELKEYSKQIKEILKSEKENNKKLNECLCIKKCIHVPNFIYTFITEFSYAIPSSEAIDEIFKFTIGEEILEIGSSLGLWASLLRLRGCNVIPTKNFLTSFTNNSKTFLQIENITEENAIGKYNTANVMFCWPLVDITGDTLMYFIGKKLIFISNENHDDKNDKDYFFKVLNMRWKLEKIIHLQISLISFDKLYFYTKVW